MKYVVYRVMSHLVLKIEIFVLQSYLTDDIYIDVKKF